MILYNGKPNRSRYKYSDFLHLQTGKQTAEHTSIYLLRQFHYFRTQEKHHPDEKKIYCDKCDKGK